jgi:vacuolar-type H+-ATPase subunit I/STV1
MTRTHNRVAIAAVAMSQRQRAASTTGALAGSAPALSTNSQHNIWSRAMTKQFSEQLADLSVRAKNAVSTLEAAQKEAHSEIAARKEQAHAAATQAVAKAETELKKVSDSAEKNWSAMRTKISSDMNRLKAGIAQAKQNMDARHAERDAERREQEAGFAIDYAIASVEQATVAVLDAIDSRADAEFSKQS